MKQRHQAISSTRRTPATATDYESGVLRNGAPGQPGRTIFSFLFLCLLTLTGCLSKRGEMGVQNEWRNPALPIFEKGRTTQTDVMQALGPPSQVIGLPDQTLFYYLREQSNAKSVYLILYNQTRQQITYDRAIFFFNKQAVLTDFSFSKEAVPWEK